LARAKNLPSHAILKRNTGSIRELGEHNEVCCALINSNMSTSVSFVTVMKSSTLQPQLMQLWGRYRDDLISQVGHISATQ